jgi:hypothetical protein
MRYKLVTNLATKEEDMQSVPYRDLQNIAPSTLRKKLNSEGVLVVTVNNKPFAAMIILGDENTEDILLLLSRLRAQMATLSIRNKACKDEMDKTTLKEVNALIKKTRAEQKQSK